VDGIGKETPLMIAATAGLTDILKCLVLAGADANVTNTVSSFVLASTWIT
jgi:ankyrin repeat protein